MCNMLSVQKACKTSKENKALKRVLWANVCKPNGKWRDKCPVFLLELLKYKIVISKRKVKAFYCENYTNLIYYNLEFIGRKI